MKLNLSKTFEYLSGISRVPVAANYGQTWASAMLSISRESRIHLANYLVDWSQR